MKKKYKDVKGETITVRMPDELSIKLAAAAFARRTTKAELVREAVDAYFRQNRTGRNAERPQP